MKFRWIFASILCLFLYSAQAQQKPKKLTWDEQLELILPPLTQQLNLDGLQEAAIRNILMNQFRQTDLIMKDGSFSEERKREESTQLINKTESDIKALLSADQLTAYDKYISDLKKGKKPPRVKKSKS